MLKTTVIINVVLCCILAFSYKPTPAPPLDPNDVPFIYDPNNCQSEPMAALILTSNIEHSGYITVNEPDGEAVTITLEGAGEAMQIDSSPVSNIKDPNDPLGMGRIYEFRWTWMPLGSDVGLYYVNVRVNDPLKAYDQRTLLILVKENKPPVITGYGRP